MRNLVFSFLALVLVSAAATKSVAHASDSEKFKIRSYETQTLKNGMTILWLPDNSLPYVTMQMLIKSGSSQDPVGKEGLAGFTAAMLEKGTTKRSATQISDDLEQIGSGFDGDAEVDFSLLSTSGLSFHRDELLKQYGELVMSPSFTNVEIERHRKNVLASLQRLADSPENFSEFLMAHYLYGNHPYGHEASGTIRSVKGLKRVDLQRFYAANYTPDNAVLAVVGQYDDAWKNQLVEMFEGWKTKAAKQIEVPDFPMWKGKEVLLVDRSDLNQAQIQIGTKGIPRKTKEYMEYRAALKILGESFGSRLFDEIRVKRGLTYSIHAWFDPRVQTGPMGIYTFTRTDKIGETVEESLKTFKKFVAEGVTDGEVSVVKALMRGQFPRTFETAEGLGKQLLLLNLYGVGADYLTDYLTNLDKIDKDSINATIKKYFDADDLRILVYAPKEKAEASLKGIGKVEIKNYTEFLK